MEVLRGFMKIAHSVFMGGFETGDRHRGLRNKFSPTGKLEKATESLSSASRLIEVFISKRAYHVLIHVHVYILSIHKFTI
jgi:hypothetical protein